MILRNLARRKARTALTVMGVALGVAAVVALTAMGQGISSGFGNMFGSSDADLTLSQRDAYDVMLSSLGEDIGERLRAMPQVGEVSGVLYSGATVETVPFFIVFGYDPDEFAIEHFQVVDGRALRGPREILLGRGAADNLKRGVGDALQIYDSAFRVVGIYETGEAFEELGGVVSVADAQLVFQRPRQVSLFMVKLRDPGEAEAARARIETQFPRALVSLGSGAGQRQEVYAAATAMALAIGLVAALVGALGVMNAIITAVFERTREIGVLRALGWRARQVVVEVLAESLALSVAGGVVGVVLGVAMVRLASLNPTFGSIVLPEFSIGLFALTGVIVVGIGLVAGAGPAWWAARLEPVEALRYEGGAGGGGALPGGALGRIYPRLPGAARNLLRRRTRSVLTLAGIGIGVAVIVALGAIAEGVKAQFSTMMGRGAADLSATQANVADLSLSAIDEDVIRRIAAMDEVDAVAGMVMGFSSLPEAPILLVFGLEPGTFAIEKFEITEGAGLRGRGDAIVGRPIADSMGLVVGDVFRVAGRPFRVAGIYETGVAYQDTGAVVSLREAQDLFEKPRQVSYFQVQLHRPGDADAVIAEVSRRFPQVAISRSADLVENTRDFQQMETMMNVLAYIAAVIGAVGVMNTVLMNVLERTREFGLLRAVGWHVGRILWSVVAETLLLGAVGTVLGAAAGVALMSLIGLVPAVGGLLEPKYTLIVFLRAASAVMVLGVAASLYPAWRATQFAPAEALRYE